MNQKQNNNMEITEDYLSFETAKLLKEKGFDEICHSVYDDKDLCSVASLNRHYDCGYGDLVITCKNTDYDDWENKIAAPTLQMAMKWLRKVHGLFINLFIYEYGEGKVAFEIEKIPSAETVKEDYEYATYEESAEAAIKYCLINLID